MHTFTLPSGPGGDLVEMTGVEEDLLTNQRLIKTGEACEAINQVLANCIKRIGENVAPASHLRGAPKRRYSPPPACAQSGGGTPP